MSAVVAVTKTPKVAAITGRDNHDALVLTPKSQLAERAQRLIAGAIAENILRTPCDTWESCVDHSSIYGVAVQARAIVVQEYRSWWSSGYRQERTEYYLLWRDGRKVVGQQLNGSSVRGTVAHDTDPAAPIRRCADLLPPILAEAVRAARRAPWAEHRSQRREGGDNFFKAVAVVQDAGGIHLCSIYDQSVEYHIGETMRQTARRGHGGGYYVRATPEEAADVQVPDGSDLADAPRAVLRCRCEGAYTRYANGKLAFSRVTPMEIVSWPEGIARPDEAAQSVTA